MLAVRDILGDGQEPWGIPCSALEGHLGTTLPIDPLRVIPPVRTPAPPRLDRYQDGTDLGALLLTTYCDGMRNLRGVLVRASTQIRCPERYRGITALRNSAQILLLYGVAPAEWVAYRSRVHTLKSRAVCPSPWWIYGQAAIHAEWGRVAAFPSAVRWMAQAMALRGRWEAAQRALRLLPASTTRDAAVGAVRAICGAPEMWAGEVAEMADAHRAETARLARLAHQGFWCWGR